MSVKTRVALVVPLPFASEYEQSTPDGRQPVRARWWMWLGRVWRHRLSPVGG